MYDAVGNLIEKTDRNERVTEYEYDNLYRLIEERWMAGVSVVQSFGYVYDVGSQLTAAGDGSTGYTYTYDNLRRVTSSTHSIAGLSDPITFDQTFDAVGNRLSLSATIDTTDDFRNEYLYDNLHRQTRVTQAGQGGGNSVASKRVDFAYNSAGQFDEINRYASTDTSEYVATSSYSYDGIGRLTELSHDQGITNLAGYAWTWDAASRITAMTIAGYSSENATFSYDTFGQLTGADRSGGSNDEAYDYDNNGSRETANGDTYTIGANNQIDSDGTFDYLYDDEGNRTRKTEIATGDYVTYDWDYRNRLTSVSFFDDSDVLQKRVTYEYDIFDRRVAKHVDENGDSIIERSEFFVYDGAHVALHFDDTGSLTNRYLHGPAIDQVLADEQVHWDAIGEDYITDTVLWTLADHLGTIRDLAEYDAGLDATTVENHRTLDTFGNITAQTDPAYSHLNAFTGREWDADAELYYYRARWYDPRLAIFLSRDPIGFAAGDPNPWRYVSNSPVTLVDPSGLAEEGPTANGLYRVTSEKRLVELYRANQISTQTYREASELLHLHRSSVNVRLQSPNTVYGLRAAPGIAASWAIAPIKDVGAGVGGAIESIGCIGGKSLEGDAGGAARSVYSTGMSAVAESRYSPIEVAYPIELLADGERLLFPPMKHADEEMLEMVNSYYIAPEHTPQRLIPSIRDGLRNAAAQIGTPADVNNGRLIGRAVDGVHQLRLNWHAGANALEGTLASRASVLAEVEAADSARVLQSYINRADAIPASNFQIPEALLTRFGGKGGYVPDAGSSDIASEVAAAGDHAPFTGYGAFGRGPAPTCEPRPGLISGNPANRLVPTGRPTQNGDWARRWIRMTQEDFDQYHKEIANRYDQTLVESDLLQLRGEAATQYRFEQMRAFRTELLRKFLEARSY